MVKFLGKILILIPFFYMIYGIISTKSYPENLFDVYFFGFLGLVTLGLVGILFNINKILGILYVLLGFGVYCYFYDQNIFNLWPVGGLLLLIDPISTRFQEKVSAVSEKVVEKVVEKPKVVEKVVEKRVERPKVVEKVVDDYWVRYDREQWRKKPLLNKLKIKFNEILLGVGKK